VDAPLLRAFPDASDQIVEMVLCFAGVTGTFSHFALYFL
jgi:hypothetical protein